MKACERSDANLLCFYETQTDTAEGSLISKSRRFSFEPFVVMHFFLYTKSVISQ